MSKFREGVAVGDGEEALVEAGYGAADADGMTE